MSVATQGLGLDGALGLKPGEVRSDSADTSGKCIDEVAGGVGDRPSA